MTVAIIDMPTLITIAQEKDMCEACRFCGSEKIMSINAKCCDGFSARMPGRSEPSKPSYNYVPGLMRSGDNDYVEFDVCLACQRVQDDLFEYSDKPKKAKRGAKPEKVWTLKEKLDDLQARAGTLMDTLAYRERFSPALEKIVAEFQAVDRCLPGLVRELEADRARPRRSGKVQIPKDRATEHEVKLASMMPQHYELV